jgi:hypothetical protein
VFFVLVERAGMYHENRRLGRRVNQIDNLEVIACHGAATHGNRFIPPMPGISADRMSHDIFRFLSRNAVFGYVVNVPLDPAKFKLHAEKYIPYFGLFNTKSQHRKTGPMVAVL